MNAKTTSWALGLTLTTLLGATGCGATYQPSRTAGFNLDSSAEINDDDVRKAFEARPQLGSALHVAYYTFEPEKAEEVEGTLKALPSVASVYRIPSLVVTGQRRYETQNPWLPSKEVSLKKLRLFAARARADVLVVVDRGYKTSGANGLVALSPLIVPVFFAPMVDTRVEGYAEAFVIDTRNGYLYGHVVKDDKRGEEYATIYGKSAETWAEEQWQDLRKDLGKELGRLIADEQRASKVAVVAPVPVPASAP